MDFQLLKDLADAKSVIGDGLLNIHNREMFNDVLERYGLHIDGAMAGLYHNGKHILSLEWETSLKSQITSLYERLKKEQ